MADAKSSPSDASNRRTNSRVLACYPAEVSGGKKPALAMIRDVSMTGALLFLQVPRDVGEEISLQLYILEDANQAVPATGRVVRLSVRPPADRGVWKYAVAVEFLEPLTSAREAIERMAKTLPPIEVGLE